MSNIYENLVWANAPGAAEAYSPGLATDWSKSEDGMTWTFNIRQGVTFHDGAALNAEAVKMSIDRHMDMAGAYWIWAPVDSVEAVDEFTLQINMSYPAPLELILASQYAAWIISPDAVAAAAEDEAYWDMGVAAGTGPYMLADYTPDAEVVLSAFPDYWGGWDDAAHFENVVVTIVADSVVQEQLLLGGEVDLALRLPESSHDRFMEDENFNVQDVQTLFNYVGFLNVTRPPLDNILVRQAISYAIPYDDIITVSVEGRATQAYGAVPFGVWPYSDDVPQYTQDLDKARELLAAAGFEGGGFELTLTYAAENLIEERFAPVMADALAEIGITVNIEPMLFGQQWELSKGDPAEAQDIFLLLWWPTYSDAGSDNLWSMFRSSEAPYFNLSYWANEEFDTLLDSAIDMSGTDLEASQELYNQAQTLMVEEAPGLFFMDVQSWYAVPTYLGGFEYNMNYPFATFFYPIYLDD